MTTVTDCPHPWPTREIDEGYQDGYAGPELRRIVTCGVCGAVLSDGIVEQPAATKLERRRRDPYA